MFNIEELIFSNYSGESYTYKLTKGLNYFKGENNSGKTVFYTLLDYMLGSSKEITNDEWYKNIKEITLKIRKNNISYILTRTKNKDENYFTVGENVKFESRISITYREYKIKLENIFTPNNNFLDNIKTFTGQEFSFRTFTIFNFLGEKRQGNIQDFLDKGRDIEYSVKLPSLLNFIFNKNLESIYNLENRLKNLEKEIKNLEANRNKNEFVIKEINNNLLILGLNIQYNGKNIEEIKERLEQHKLMNEDITLVTNNKSISELTLMLNSINEQIKTYESYKQGIKNIEKENINRKNLLIALESIIKQQNEYSYLLSSIKKLLNEINTTISFSQYSICDKTMDTLKKQKELIKSEIKKHNSNFKLYTMKEKEKAVILLENFLKENILDSNDELTEKVQEVKRIKEKLLELKNNDNKNIINNLSEYITNLYYSAKDVSDFVKIDTDRFDFQIRYIKKGNILQPMIKEVVQINNDENNRELTLTNYYTGSMARHTLIQLCGYLGFLNLLINAGSYPIIPIFVGDHLSKNFDDKNVKAIGEVLNKGIENIKKNNIQIFLFDDEECSKLGLKPDNNINLIEYNNSEKIKTGFIPFYKPIIKQKKNEEQ